MDRRVKQRSGVRRRAHVLVVDDTVAVRLALRRMLECTGYRVTEAADGEDALCACARELPDVIVLDGDMPGMDGQTFAGSISRALGDATPPIIVVSGDLLAEADLPWPGVVAAFPKPPPIDRFLRAVHENTGRMPRRARSG